jgi:hypothetical protein
MPDFMKPLLRQFAFLVSRLFDNPLSPPTDAERRLCEQLKTETENMPLPPAIGVSAAENEWLSFLSQLRDNILNNDPREFLRWPVIMRTMFVTFPPYVFGELRFLREQNWRDRWKEAIGESDVGRPHRYPFYPTSSGNLIHYAYHLASFERRMRASISDMSCVVEFGGGYGGMCRLIHRLGFKGRYVIFDLPYFSALQRYYLRSNGQYVGAAADVAKFRTGIACVSTVDDLRMLTERIDDKQSALFLATWSLSEAPIAVRAPILPLLMNMGNVLVGYQERFGEVDNRLFFTDWVKARPDLAWKNESIPQLPGNWYLFGRSA